MPPDIYRLKSIVLVLMDIISWDFMDVKIKIDTKCIENRFESERIAILIKWRRIPALVGGPDIRQPKFCLIHVIKCYPVNTGDVFVASLWEPSNLPLSSAVHR